MLNRKVVGQFDFLLFGGALLLSVLGLLAIYSATTQGAEGGLVQRQATWISLGILVCLAANAVRAQPSSCETAVNQTPTPCLSIAPCISEIIFGEGILFNGARVTYWFITEEAIVYVTDGLPEMR